jgi:hypothetical protein
MGSFITVYYSLQLVACIAVTNFYGDADRFTSCGPDKANTSPIDSANVFDGVLLLLAIYHIIEWLKTTLLLTVACVGLNLMHVYYFLGLNTLFGIFVIFYTMIVLFSEEGSDCAKTQYYRGLWIEAEIVGFWALFFLYPGPILALRGCSKEAHEEILNKESDDEDSDSDGGSGGEIVDLYDEAED